MIVAAVLFSLVVLFGVPLAIAAEAVIDAMPPYGRCDHDSDEE